MSIIIKALKKAAATYPYYTKGFLALTFVESKEVKTMGVDKFWRVYYNPKFCEENSHTLYNVIRHELEHLLREHSSRIREKNFKKWNIAADMEINDEIAPLPLNCYYPKTFDCEEHKTAEFYYNYVTEDNNETEGSGVCGKTAPWEISEGDKNCPSVSETEAEILKDSIAEDINDFIHKNPGTVPNGIRIWAEARATEKLPKIKWQNIVAKKIKEIISGRIDYSYNKISRRQNPNDKVIIPSSISGLPSCALVVDTSGSMSELSNWIAGCTKDILRLFKNNVTLIDCDAEVHQVRRLKHWKQITSSLGGGGTDMRKGIEYAKNKTKADIILVLTDGYTPWPNNMTSNIIPIIKQND